MEISLSVDWNASSMSAVTPFEKVRNMRGTKYSLYYIDVAFKLFLFTLKTKNFHVSSIWQLGNQKFGTLFRVHQSQLRNICRKRGPRSVVCQRRWRNCASNSLNQKDSFQSGNAFQRSSNCKSLQSCAKSKVLRHSWINMCITAVLLPNKILRRPLTFVVALCLKWEDLRRKTTARASFYTTFLSVGNLSWFEAQHAIQNIRAGSSNDLNPYTARFGIDLHGSLL